MSKTMQVVKGADSARDQDHLILGGQTFSFDQVQAALRAIGTVPLPEIQPDFSWYQGEVDVEVVRAIVRLKRENRL